MPEHRRVHRNLNCNLDSTRIHLDLDFCIYIKAFGSKMKTDELKNEKIKFIRSKVSML